MAGMTGEMKRLADNLGKYIRDKFLAPKLANTVSYFKATVVTAADGSVMQVQRAFDPTVYSLPYLPAADGLQAGDSCICMSLGSTSNSFVFGPQVKLSATNTVSYNYRDYRTTKTAASAIYRYMFVFTDKNGNLVPSCNTSNSTSTSKTLTTTAFDPHLPIYYYTSTTTVSANGSPNASNLYKKYSSCNMRYGFNCSTTGLTNKAPVYIKCSPQTDGTVKLAGNNCLVQALPTTADGYVYIFLGYTYSQYQVELCETHPIHEYKNNALRLWTGP